MPEHNEEYYQRQNADRAAREIPLDFGHWDCSVCDEARAQMGALEKEDKYFRERMNQPDDQTP